MNLPTFLLIHFFYGSMFDAIELTSGASVLSKYSERDVLPPLVPPKLVAEDDDFDERDLDSSRNPLAPTYWAPTLENLTPGEAEFYRKAILDSIVGHRDARSMGMLRMGRSADGVRRSGNEVRRSMTMLRMGRRAFDDVDDDVSSKRSMGMLRMGRSDDFRKSMSMLRMGRGFSDADEEVKRSMGMLRMGRAANKNMDKGALNMLRMGKREAGEEEGENEGVASVAESQQKS